MTVQKKVYEKVFSFSLKHAKNNDVTINNSNGLQLYYMDETKVKQT